MTAPPLPYIANARSRPWRGALVDISLYFSQETPDPFRYYRSSVKNCVRVSLSHTHTHWVSRKLWTCSSLPFWPSFDASWLVVKFHKLWLILGDFAFFHYKIKRKSAAHFVFGSLSLCLWFSTRSVLVNGNAVELKVTLFCVWCQM